MLDYKPLQTIVIKQEDCEISWFSGTGPGGQNRNKKQACCRLKHIPTGIVITAQTRERSSSLAQAMADLTIRVQSLSNSTSSGDEATIRKSQVGSGQRGDFIRLIKFQHNLAKDIRTEKSITADEFMKGNMDKMWS